MKALPKSPQIHENITNIANTYENCFDPPNGDALTPYPESLSEEDFTGKSFPFTAWDHHKVPSNLAQAGLRVTWYFGAAPSCEWERLSREVIPRNTFWVEGQRVTRSI